MTNGEMIKSIFPSAEIDIGNGGNDIWIAIDCWTIFKKEWWNAEYKEPTTKNDLGVDCISRQAAITFVCKNTKEILKDTMPLEVKLSSDYIYENVAKIMGNPKVLPSVTPQEPRKGHWIMTGDYYTGAYGTIDYVECSCCHEDSLEEGNYCPNCGAKMVEPQESEDKE